MATQGWLELLPKPQMAYGVEPQNAVLQSPYETGVPVQRLRFETRFELVSVVWLMSDYEYLLFKTWFATKLRRGTRKFNIDLPIGDGGVQTYEAQWVSGRAPYKTTYQKVLHWEVTAILRIQKN